MAEAAQAELKQSAKEVEKSAGTLAHSTGQIKDSAERRTELAADRNVLAYQQRLPAQVQISLFPQRIGVHRATIWVRGRPLSFRQVVWP